MNAGPTRAYTHARSASRSSYHTAEALTPSSEGQRASPLPSTRDLCWTPLCHTGLLFLIGPATGSCLLVTYPSSRLWACRRAPEVLGPRRERWLACASPGIHPRVTSVELVTIDIPSAPDPDTVIVQTRQDGRLRSPHTTRVRVPQSAFPAWSPVHKSASPPHVVDEFHDAFPCAAGEDDIALSRTTRSSRDLSFIPSPPKPRTVYRPHPNLETLAEFIVPS